MEAVPGASVCPATTILFAELAKKGGKCFMNMHFIILAGQLQFRLRSHVTVVEQEALSSFWRKLWETPVPVGFRFKPITYISRKWWRSLLNAQCLQSIKNFSMRIITELSSCVFVCLWARNRSWNLTCYYGGNVECRCFALCVKIVISFSKLGTCWNFNRN